MTYDIHGPWDSYADFNAPLYNNDDESFQYKISIDSSVKALSYESIISDYITNPDYILYFHEESLVPWLFNGSTLISYDDARSIALKAEYIKEQNLGGAVIWELSQ